MAISKRESRLRRWAKKLGSCVRHCQPHRRCKSNYLETEKTGPQPIHRSNIQNSPRNVIFGRREQPPKKSKSEGSAGRDRSSMRALPSIGKLQSSALQDIHGDKTIRVVNPSQSSLLVGRPSYSNSFEPLRRHPEILHKHPHGVLPWKESLQIQRAINRPMPQYSTNKHDSATDLSLRPLQTRPHETRSSDDPPTPPPSHRLCRHDSFVDAIFRYVIDQESLQNISHPQKLIQKT